MNGYSIDLTFLVLLGITGSLHCAGMCGALCATYTIPVRQDQKASLWKFHLVYVSGRLLAYGWIGALLGALGMGFYMAAAPDSIWRNVGALLAGLILVIGGISSFFGKKWPERIAAWVAKALQILLPSLDRWKIHVGPWRVFLLGMVSGILPCGLMWAVEMRAFATNSLLLGMVTMLIFCLITSPAVLLTGTIVTKVSPYLRYRSMQLAGILVVAMGVRLIWTHFIANDLWLRCLPPL